MDSIQVYGGTPLGGRVKIQGSKNAALPILAATVLIPGESILHNCPQIEDVRLMCELLQTVGCRVSREGHTIRVDASGVDKNTVRMPGLPASCVEKMRSSVILMGALLGRAGEAALQYPGGCVIGKRPIDLHLWAMKQFGVQTRESGAGITAQASQLSGASVVFPMVSVGATENAVLAAVCADGETVLEGAAMEPEIGALCGFLKSAGAKLDGNGMGCLRITGNKALHGCEYTIPSDRIVAGTYLLACAAAGGEICLEGAPESELGALFDVLERMGAELNRKEGRLFCKRKRTLTAAGTVRTAVYPGYPTDLQSQLLAAAAVAEGETCVTETIFENRFRVVEQLKSMGADIRVEGSRARVRGSRRLYGSTVQAKELRGGAALVMAALTAEGKSIVYGREYIDRGYEDIAGDFRALGAQIAYEENRELPEPETQTGSQK